MKYVYPYITIEIISGSGFYVRSLARDVGKKLGTGGYISDLKRICIYNPTNQEIDFKIQDCLTIDDLEKEILNFKLKRRLYKLNKIN
jgi:tRNA pseudouridine55 synthase